MKNGIRIAVIVSVLIGGTAFFSYQSLNNINDALDSVSASYIAIAEMPSIPSGDRARTEETSTTTPEGTSTSTPIILSTVATSTDVELSLTFPKKSSTVYIGCTYRLLLQSSTTIHSLHTALIDAGTREASGPIASGLAKEYKIQPDSQHIDWKVGVVWPGDYFILISNINGIEKETKSKYFAIHKMPEGTNASERGTVCKGSGGSL